MTEDKDGTIGEAPKSEIPPGTKFRKGGFKPAAEVIAEAEGAAAAAEAAPEAEPTDDIMNAAIAADEAVTFEQTEGLEIPGVPQPQAAEAAPEAPQTAKIRIGSKEFTNQEEAFAYAEELERQRDAADAFRLGVEAATKVTPGNPEPAAPPEPQELDPEYYTNPQEYWRKREQQIIDRAEQRVQQSIQRQRSHEETWNKFYSDYPDLSQVRDIVEMTRQQHWGTLQHMQVETGLKELADKTRAKLRSYVQAQMPKVILPKGPPTTASPGGAPGVTSRQAPKPVLNFAQQVKQNKRGKAAR